MFVDIFDSKNNGSGKGGSMDFQQKTQLIVYLYQISHMLKYQLKLCTNFVGKNLVSRFSLGVLLLLNYFMFIPLFISDSPHFSMNYLVAYHILFFLMVWSLTNLLRKNPGKIPAIWKLENEDNQTRKRNKRRYCLLCQIFKPKRTHHCSSCSACLLAMYYHCPWASCCICFYNRKYYLLFLLYRTLLLALSVIIETLSLFAEFMPIQGGVQMNFGTILRSISILGQALCCLFVAILFSQNIKCVLVNTINNCTRKEIQTHLSVMIQELINIQLKYLVQDVQMVNSN